MTDERPLHVRVAEALGWTECIVPAYETEWVGRDLDADPNCSCHGTHCHPQIPRYDTDWSATGPLIERLRIAVTPAPTRWYAESFRNCRYGDTPLEAVCLLLLALHEADHLADLLAIGR